MSRQAVLCLVIRIPDDYEGEAIYEAYEKLMLSVPEELRAFGHAAIDEAATPFIKLMMEVVT